jgi:hypothetical protein
MISRAPTLSYFAQQVAIPSISLQELIQPTTLSTTISLPGNKYDFKPLSVKFLVDEINKNKTITLHELNQKLKDKYKDANLSTTQIFKVSVV